MKFKSIFIFIFLIEICRIDAQNCIQVNQTNIAGINNIISNLSNSGGGCIQIDNDDYYNVPFISLKSNIVLRIHGRLHRNYGILGVTNCDNVRIIGDNIGALIYNGSNVDSTAKGIQIKNSRNVDVSGLKITGFRNKGILLRGPNTNNINIQNNYVEGANSSTGTGIAITDDEGGVSFCNIELNHTTDNRIGISVNKSKFISIVGNHSYSNYFHGIGLDGIVSLAGDGPQNCIISNNQVYNNGGDTCVPGKTKSGIFLGNGAQKNIVSNNIIRNNKCHGIFYYEDSNNQNSSYNNSFISNQIIDNEEWGIRLRNSKRAIIANNQIIQNGSGGIQLDESNSNLISSNNIILNGEIGINFKNSSNNKVPEETNIIENQTHKYKHE